MEPRLVRVKREGGVVKLQYPNSIDWVHTKISERMQLGTESIRNIKALLDGFLTADADTINEPDTAWMLRISQQRQIGMSLCRIAFGEELGFDPRGWLHFVPDRSSDDKFLDFFCRIPWIMLTSEASGMPPFLAIDGVEPVMVTVDASPVRMQANYDITCPSAARLLLVMPEVHNGGTSADQHYRDICNALGPHYQALGASGNIRRVTTYEDFVDCMLTPDPNTGRRFNPDLIYFYGHGSTDGKGTSFQFEEDGEADWRDVAEITDVVGRVVQQTGKPPFIWFNACSGAAANQDSALRLLSSVASCVIAMRTVVRVGAGQQLARDTLKAIIVDRLSPPMALRSTLPRFSTSWMKSGQWASVVVSVQFNSWTALGDESRVASYFDAVGDFPRRVDRSVPLDTIYAQLGKGLGTPESDDSPVVVGWYGTASQAPTIFEDRVRDLLIERLPLFNAVIRRVELQAQVRTVPNKDGLENQLRTSILMSLRGKREVSEANTARLVSLINGAAYGRNTVLALLHGPLANRDVDMVLVYLRLWSKIFQALRGQPYAPRIVLGFGFEDDTRPTKLIERYPAEPLGTVPPREIALHLQRYRQFYDIESGDIPQESEDLYHSTDGSLARLVAKLEDIRDSNRG